MIIIGFVMMFAGIALLGIGVEYFTRSSVTDRLGVLGYCASFFAAALLLGFGSLVVAGG